MENFLIFFLTFIAFISIFLFCLRLGMQYVFAFIAFISVICAFSITIPIDFFAWPVLLAEVFYAIYFFATDAVSENYGEEEAKKLVWVLLSSILLIIGFGKFIIFLSPELELAKAFLPFFGPISITLLIIILFVMFFEQRLDIFIYSKIKKKTGGKFLWLRNCVSTFLTQSVDILVVYPLFFWPIFGADTYKLMLIGFLFKMGVAVLDTPFLYLSKKICKLGK